MHVYYSDIFELPLPAGHRFPVRKYRAIRERLESMTNVMLTLQPAPAVTRAQLALVHSAEYLQKVFDGALTDIEQRRIGFPWSEAMVKRCLHSAGGTLAAARAAVATKCAAHLAGGTHHAFADAGQGFCVFNDVAVAIQVLRAEMGIESALVIDCDVHQGNGTAAIFSDDDAVFTFSMHGSENFPFRKHDSDLDMALPNGTDDASYIQALELAFERFLPLDSSDHVFYLAGADPYEGDRYGKLALTKDGLSERDAMVIDRVFDAGVPLTVVMAGGYAENITDIVDIQANTVVTAAKRM